MSITARVVGLIQDESGRYYVEIEVPNDFGPSLRVGEFLAISKEDTR